MRLTFLQPLNFPLLRRPRTLLVCRRTRATRASATGLGPDDRADVSSDDFSPTELTLEQQLLMKTYVEQVSRMSKAECDDLAQEVIRQSMVKDNLLKTLGVKMPDDWLMPPDPKEFSERDLDGEDKRIGGTASD
jgi:Phycobilisome degradation protein nblA